MNQRIITRIRLILFYFFNRFQFKELEFSAVIVNPLRIEGKKHITIKKRSIIKSSAWLLAIKIDQYDPELIIGEGSSVGDFSHIAAVRKVEIGKHVLMANRIYISDNVHASVDIKTPIMHQPVVYKSEVVIGDGSWLGENVCVIGAKIGKNCVIGANAVVTKDIPDYSVAAGVPAIIIKRYDEMTGQWRKTTKDGKFL